MVDIQVKSFPASYGDSFLVTIKYENKKYNILIDCGLQCTYTDYIKSELANINSIDLLVLTHIDDDHINGAIELFKDDETLSKINIKNIWFNDLYKILKTTHITKSIEQGESDEIVNKTEILDEEVGFKSAKQLSNYIIEKGYLNIWNKDQGIIQCEDKLYKELYPINSDIKFILLSPTSMRIKELLNEWIDYCNIDITKVEKDNRYLESFYNYFKNCDKFAEIFDEDCSSKSIDLEKLSELEFNKNSVSNNSSIAFIIEIKDKKMLFLGDSNADDIKNSISKYMEEKGLMEIKFDLVKVSHHGSKNNTTKEFFDMFYSDKYLISTNGMRDNHPDLECLSKIIVKQTKFKNIIFNYNRNDLRNELDSNKLKEKYKYDLTMPIDSEKNMISIINV